MDRLLMKMSEQLSNDDTEDAHQQADFLLVKLVELLAKGHPERQIILDIVAKYKSIGKWYA